MNILFFNIKISKLHSYIHLNLVTSLPRPWRAFRVSRASARRVPRSPRRRHRCRARGRLEQAGARAHSNPSRRLVRARGQRATTDSVHAPTAARAHTCASFPNPRSSAFRCPALCPRELASSGVAWFAVLALARIECLL